MSVVESLGITTSQVRPTAPAPPQPASVANPPAVSREALELLAWVARQPRRYAEAMEVWQTSCPRHSIWEDALADALIEVESAGGRSTQYTQVTLTSRGRAVLRRA